MLPAATHGVWFSAEAHRRASPSKLGTRYSLAAELSTGGGIYPIPQYPVQSWQDPPISKKIRSLTFHATTTDPFALFQSDYLPPPPTATHHSPATPATAPHHSFTYRPGLSPDEPASKRAKHATELRASRPPALLHPVAGAMPTRPETTWLARERRCVCGWGWMGMVDLCDGAWDGA